MFGYIVQCNKQVWQIPPETRCILLQFHTMFLTNMSENKNEQKVQSHIYSETALQDEKSLCTTLQHAPPNK
jgi:hypothetical protein